jgi:hypothetical protein
MALKNSIIKEPRQRNYLARDFDSLRAELVNYARRYYPDKIQDFSENGLGGLLIDFAAFVGDNMAFYLDHQYHELDPSLAVENRNVERHLLNSGVPVSGASPAVVDVSFYVQVPAGPTGPNVDALPIVKANSTLLSDNGVQFILLEDIDFTKKKANGDYYATIKIGKTSPSGAVLTYVLFMSGQCISGQETTDTFEIGSQFVPFRQLTLTNAHITQIISAYDSLGNDYYEVSALTDDVVYQNIPNYREDSGDVPEAIKIIPVPYRFTKNVNIGSRKTTLTFGGGSADSLEDDIIPDPSSFAIRYPYRRTFSRQPINPTKMMQTNTLGVAGTNTTLYVTYRYGGGLSHNVGPNEIRIVSQLTMTFPNNPSAVVAAQVRNSVEVSNENRAAGGEDALTINELKDLIPATKAAQERMVSRQDLLAHVYTIPSNFGRVYRAAVRANPNNPMATQLFIISRDAQGLLVTAPDSLKLNLVKYLSPYRMISDAIDVLDGQIINLRLNFDVVIDPSLNKQLVLTSVLNRLQQFFKTQNFYIDQPIILSEVRNSLSAIRGVISVRPDALTFTTMTGVVNNRSYSDRTFDVASNTFKDIIFPPPGGMFEIRYPEVDIIGRAV